ncbi:von Willebrand factor A [Sulfolobus acidocaldarius SUSAZ]|nr:von Willebrand factor A [Sulfolobus acidocaldarius SUSAZ]
MTISVKAELSHKYSFTSPLKGVFRLIIVPEKVSTARGFHYIILLDTSGSMYGVKIETAKQGAMELLSRIPEGNKISFLTFSNNVNILSEYADAPSLVQQIKQIRSGGQTVLFRALERAIEIAKKHDLPGYIILLTDGQPTDVPEIEAYEKLNYPEAYKVIAFGIGDDYNERLLKVITDKTAGVLYHVEDAKEIAEMLPQSAVTEIGAKNASIDIVSETQVKLLNYPGPPVKLGAVESVVRVYGEIIIPPNFSGRLATVKISYEDPLSSRINRLEVNFDITRANDVKRFLDGINNDLVNEYRYYELMSKLANQLNSNNLSDATRTVEQMQMIAQQTRRMELIETTRRISESIETTRRIGTVEQTRKISKEITSEVTKKLRS